MMPGYILEPLRGSFGNNRPFWLRRSRLRS